VVVLAVAVLAFVSNRIAPPLVALGVALSLFVTGTVTLPETLAGFGDPVVQGVGDHREQGPVPPGGPAPDLMLVEPGQALAGLEGLLHGLRGRSRYSTGAAPATEDGG
jgi:di/tricarboxylate transporter